MSSNKRSSVLLSTLSAINTSFMSPAMTDSPSVFSSATISSMASSVSPSNVKLEHPSPRRYEALNSPLLKADGMTLPKITTPPPRPMSPLSPVITRNFSFLDAEESPIEYSPLSATSEYYCLRPETAFRQQWTNTANAPTPPPVKCPILPSTAAQRAAIRLWESRITRRTPAPPSPRTPAEFDHETSKLVSPVEQDIQELSMQINELHQNIAHSDGLFKHGMMSVYMQQNVAASRLAQSPTDADYEDLFMRPSSVNSVSSTASFARCQRSHAQRSAEARTRAMMAAREREEQRKNLIKMTLMDRLEREVDEIERRALRDLQMVREARYALRMEIEREHARERRRQLEAELVLERERQAAEDAQIADEEEADRLLASLNAATDAVDDAEDAIVENATVIRCFTPADITLRPFTPTMYNESIESSPSLTRSLSTRPSTAYSRPAALTLNCTLPVSSAPNTGASLKSPLLTFLASPISPCSPQTQMFTFATGRASLESNGFAALGFQFADIGTIDSAPLGAMAACA